MGARRPVRALEIRELDDADARAWSDPRRADGVDLFPQGLPRDLGVVFLAQRAQIVPVRFAQGDALQVLMHRTLHGLEGLIDLRALQLVERMHVRIRYHRRLHAFQQRIGRRVTSRGFERQHLIVDQLVQLLLHEPVARAGGSQDKVPVRDLVVALLRRHFFPHSGLEIRIGDRFAVDMRERSAHGRRRERRRIDRGSDGREQAQRSAAEEPGACPGANSVVLSNHDRVSDKARKGSRLE